MKKVLFCLFFIMSSFYEYAGNLDIGTCAPVWYRDTDGDGFGASRYEFDGIRSNTQPPGYVSNDFDLDDGNYWITNIAPQSFYRDYDLDTFGDSSVRVYYSVKQDGFVANSLDCNDADATLNPNTVWYLDADKDGFGISGVSNKTQCANPSIVDGVQYVRNATDCNDGDATLKPSTVWYLDSDKDGFGISGANNKTQCANPSIVNGVQYVRNATDCNDGDATLNPNTVWYLDADKDGFGISGANNKTQCANPSIVNGVQYARNATDCNDGDATLNPNTVWYLDSDKDGFGISGSNNKKQCTNPSIVNGVQYVRNLTDCNDLAANINPNTKWYADIDADGLGDPASFLQQCVKPAGNYVIDNTDKCPLIRGTGTDCANLKAPSLDQNYIITATYKQPTTAAFVNPDPSKAQVSIMYFDGLGRPIQQIANQQSGTGKDIITHIEYDGFGRQTLDYLPYTNTGSNMVYDQNALTNATSYYSKAIYDNTSNPFSEKKLESSPLNRVLKQAAPGADWAMNAGHEIKLDYQTNTATEVKLYKATTTWNPSSGLYDISFSDGGNYGVNQLYKTITYDENSAASPTESSGSTVEFKNKEGQVVLKRTYESTTKHDTYYVYDNYGNLTYVLPPLFTNAAGQLDGLCYQYKYDHRNRLVEKKLPGKQWEFIVYDKLDRPVATGPAFSPFSDSPAGTVGWMITKYDVFDRPVYTGWEKSTTVNAAGRTAKQTAMNGLTTISESKQTTSRTIGTVAGVLYYSNSVLPTTFELLTVNYYDDYVFQAFTPAIAYTAPVAYNNTTLKPKGLATGSWTRALKTVASTIGESSYTLYDAKARPVKTFTTNHLGGSTQIDNTLNAFSGQLLATETLHKRLDGDAVLYLKDTYTYTAQDRLETHVHKIGTAGVPQLLVKNEYDELGQLIVKKVGGTNITGASYLQKMDYTYNIRGWLTSINNDATNNLVLNTTEKDLFGFKINYNTIKNETGYTGQALYNGNISETYWRTASDNVQRKYGYKYDKLNRLKESIFQKPGNTAPVPKSYDENLSYDPNGNIINLTRNGDIEGALPVNIIDNLVYTYKTNTNTLLNVLDNSNNSSGFKDGNKTGDDYSYDANGNLITDKNKNITTIVYNHLNLPTKITFDTTGTIEYIYNATGQKLEKIVTQGTTITSTNYLGGYQYTKPHLGTWALQFFPTAEGYVKNTVVSGANTYSYVFNYTDHLGNVRLSYSDADKNGIIATTEIMEENNYYPFGLKHGGYNGYVATDYKYKYNGKELQDELGLNMYDYGWRNYMPDIGRWTQIDPLFNDLKFANDINNVDEDDQQEVYMSIINDLELGGAIFNTDNLNPYGYGYNNPISFDDPDGRCPACWGALMGAAVEYGGQVIANRIEGKSWGDSFSDIDVGDVLVSAGEGALTGGASAIRSVATKAAITVGSEVIKNTLDVKIKGGKPNVKVNDAKTVARNTVIGLAVNGAGKAIPSTKIKVKAEITSKQAVRTARAAGAVTRAERKEIQAQAKKVLKNNKAINKTVNGASGATVSGGAAETVKRKEDKANGN